ncbi:MAG: NADH dehydrogenase (quinone) subunit D [Candidatus Eisenbacteria bacterium]|nr:NADH dehydrogenase (quinone) subunit D [Candidatus Eisenbacteria bacterium]
MTVELKERVDVGQILQERFPSCVVKSEEFRGDLAVTVRRDGLLEVVSFLKNEPQLDFDLLLDICGVDRLGRSPRFDCVYHLRSLSKRRLIRLKVPLDENDPEVSSITSVWKGANWFERETYDLFGLKFKGHPNLRRILTHEDFKGHALRKDYPADRRHPLARTTDALTTWPESVGEHPERMVVNIGPSHPATHGTLRIQAVIEGETVVESDSEIGYLHRCFEKMAENHTYAQIVAYTDRLNYCSSFMNNAGFALAVEKLLDIQVPERIRLIRVILSELTRIMDHLVAIAANLVDLGAITNFWYFFRPREEIYDLLEACCGARLTVNYARIGGFPLDVPESFVEMVNEILRRLPRFIDDVDRLNTKNRIFQGRTRNIGVMKKEDAIEWGFTGPCLRASGVEYDVRKAHPYLDYESFDFVVPVGTNGDIYDRIAVRMEEMRQSMRIVKQAMKRFGSGPYKIDEKTISLPEKDKAYSDIESLINHFKLVMEGITPPSGEVYSYTEAANGELGFYLISDGGPKPYRLKVRPPCFPIFQGMNEMLKGTLVADSIAILASLNIIAGELDR